MTEPTTAAGRRMVLDLANRDGGGVPTGALLTYWGERILAIEAEARQQDAPALREALERIEEMWPPLRESADASAGDIARAALAALPPSAPAGLDVERLARAYRNLNVLAGDGDSSTPADGDPEGWEEDWAKEFAAEYARLEQDHP